MAEIAWKITVFLALGPWPWPNQPLPKWMQKFISLKQMQGSRVIRQFIVHRVTELQSHRVAESQCHRVMTYPLLIRVGEIFMPIFNKFPYSFRSQGNKHWYQCKEWQCTQFAELKLIYSYKIWIFDYIDLHQGEYYFCLAKLRMLRLKIVEHVLWLINW